MLLLCPLPPGGQRHQPARSHHSGAPGAWLPATRISIRQVHCRASPAPGYAHVRNRPGSLRRNTAHARPPGARVGYGPDLAGPARPALPSGARTTMDVPELDSDWTGGAANQRHPPRSLEDTGLGPTPRHPASVDRLGLDLQRRSRRSSMQHGGLITAATPSQVLLATTHTTLGPSKHPSVSRPTRAGPMPRRDQVNTSPAQRAHPRIAR